MAITIYGMQREAHRNAVERGFHDSTANIWKWLGNVHAEVSEAWEEARQPGFDPTRTRVCDDGKPEGFPSELADIVIRIGDIAEALGINLEDAVERKMAYNRTRPYRHGNKNA